jgi:hypothetical protein
VRGGRGRVRLCRPGARERRYTIFIAGGGRSTGDKISAETLRYRVLGISDMGSTRVRFCASGWNRNHARSRFSAVSMVMQTPSTAIDAVRDSRSDVLQKSLASGSMHGRLRLVNNAMRDIF